ncbi:MAG: hypothetical protein ACFFAH_06595 [Promethearchaeota archaeon]
MLEDRKKKLTKRILYIFPILMVISINIISTGTSSVDSYQIALNRGTENYIVSQYDEDVWEENVDGELEPDDLFGGDSDTIGAKSKITIRSVDEYKWDTYEILVLIFNVLDHIPDDKLLFFMKDFTEDSITTLDSEEYKVWEAISVKWDYETEEFKEDPDDSDIIIPIFKNPKDYSTILDVYNSWVKNVNFTLNLLQIEPYPILNGDDFLWNLILDNKMILAQPFEKFLKKVIDTLDCKDAEVKDDQLIIIRDDIDEYTIEITYGSQGTPSNIVFKDSNGVIFYEITQDNTTLITLILSIGAIIISIIGIIYVFIKRSKKFK